MQRIREAIQDLRLPPLPFWAVAFALIGLVASWVPLALIVRSRVSFSTKPRIELFQGMAAQPKLKAQAPSTVFADGRAMRPNVPGTVARGELVEDDHLAYGFEVDADLKPVLVDLGDGKKDNKWYSGLPESLEVSEPLLRRGQTMYNVYCMPCHGYDGSGQGPVHLRAIELREPTWIPPTALTSAQVRDRADGHIYNTIANGIRNMSPYGDKVTDPRDRWAIVAYIRALQLSQDAPLDAVPAEGRAMLKGN